MTGPASRTTALAVAAALGSAGVLVLASAGDLRWDTGQVAAQVALDSVAATVGLLLAFLVYGRFRESRLQGDALLCAALLVLGSGNALLGVVPVVLAESPRLSAASAVAGLGAGALFAAAVWVPAARVRQHERRQVLGLLGLLTLLVLLAAWALGRLLPRAGPVSVDTVGATPDRLLSAVQLLAAVAFAAAAVGWCRREVQGEAIAAPLAVAAVLGAGSRVGFAIASSAGSSWATAATTLRMGFYLVLVAAAVVQIRGYWQTAAAVAVLEERRRIARDLHDGLAQELAFTATQARALAARSDNPTRAHLVAGAAERALDESRRAIAALTRPVDEPLAVAVAQCAEDVCGRFDASLDLDVQADLEVPADVREALVRIVREAVSNAVRHGCAQAVTVRLSGPAPVLLCVEDDGTGFDVDDPRHLSGRFGLQSMRERAEALGGTFRLTSRSPGGTAVEVVLP